MAYNGTTKYIELPYMETGDYLSGYEEKRRACILDGLVYAATYSLRDAIITDAVYSLTGITDTLCYLKLRSPGTKYVLQAVLGRRFLCIKREPEPIKLIRGHEYYIYLEKDTGFETDPTKCNIIAKTAKLADGLKLLLAKVDFTGDTPVLVTDTSIGKKLYADMVGHSVSNNNPHGNNVTQSNLSITNTLKVTGEEILPCRYRTIQSAGADGSLLSAMEDFVPVFVHATPTNLSIGNVACNIQNDNSIVVYNDGDTGLDIYLKIEGRCI